METITQTKRLGAVLLLMLTCMLPSLAVDYGITVGGVKVTSDNMNNIKGSSITSGSVTYNPSSKRLTLNDVSITYTSGYGISSKVEGLEIYFTGTNNYIKATFPLDINATATVRGTSASVNLQLDATISPIYVNQNTNLTIKDIAMRTNGGTSSGAIRGYGSNSTLILRNANLSIAAGEYPCVKGITNCIMDGCDVATPTGVCYRKSLNGFGTKTALATGTLTIFKVKEYYPVSLCGHQLNDVNTKNFYYDNVEGSVTFRETTQMISQGVYSVRQILFLNGVTGHFDDPINYCIMAIDNVPLTINCQGTNTFTSSHHAGLFTHSSNAEVWGGGTLDLNGNVILNTTSGSSNFLVGDGSTLNATFIRGAGNGTFTVNNSQVNLSGNNENDNTAISGFENVSLYKVDFVEPNDGTYSQYVRDENGNKWNGAVRIGEKSFGVTVGGVAVTTKNMDNITGSNISGSVSFSHNGDEYTLNLEDVTINNRQGYGIGNRSGKTLRVKVNGNCSVTGTHAIYSEGDLIINGNLDIPSLTVKGSITGILVSDKKKLSIGFTNITASGATSYGCIRGGGHSKLVMLYADIDIDAGSYPCVKGFDTCSQGLMEVSYPGETWFSSSLTGYGNANGLTTGDLILKRVSENYGIEVAGHELNDLNKDNFFYENVSGIVEYSPDLSVLTLAELTADCKGTSRGINIVSNKDVTIYFEGDNKFYNTYNNIGINADMGDKGLYIFGYGSLEFDGGLDIIGDLIMTEEEGDEHTMKAKYIRGTEDNDFRVSNYRVYLDGDGVNSTIRGFRSIEGENYTFARPINATYSDGQLWANGQTVTGKVVISYVDHDTAIDEAVQAHDVTVDSTYDLLGRRSDARRSGIILQHMSDGTVRKQLVK